MIETVEIWGTRQLRPFENSDFQSKMDFGGIRLTQNQISTQTWQKGIEKKSPLTPLFQRRKFPTFVKGG
jgi:hypothetical protein